MAEPNAPSSPSLIYWWLRKHLISCLSFSVALLLVALFSASSATIWQGVEKKPSSSDALAKNIILEQKAALSVERNYPITSNQKVNQLLADIINQMHSKRGALILNQVAWRRLFYQERIDFHPELIHDNFFSLTINQYQNFGSGLRLAHQVVKNLDLKTGKNLRISDFFADLGAIEQTFLPDLRFALLSSHKAKDLQPSEELLKNKINLASIDYFVLKPKAQWHFVLKPDVVRELGLEAKSVSLPIAAYSRVIYPDLLARLLELDRSKSQVSQVDSCQQHSCVALTFDDGPGAYTDRLLTILRRNQVPATFFVLGSRAQHQTQTLRRMFNEGHQIANHSWSHRDFTRLSLTELQQEIQQTNQIISQITKQDVSLTRPPYGSYNGRVLQELSRLRQAVILWSVDPRDWADRNSQIVQQRVLESTRRGSIVLLHDIHATSVEAVPTIIAELKARGYHLVTLDTLFAGSLRAGERYFSR